MSETPDLRGAAGARVEAQAKINLRLKILAREASGFHQLETLLLRLALADTVRVRRTGGSRSLEVSGLADKSAIGPAERNLAWRAAESYLAAAGLPGGFAIELEKRIPIGGGLGGGSADAGGVLRALDAIAPDPLGETSLLRIAASLGADVPFLTTEHAYSLAWGRGERLLALRPPPPRDVQLLTPEFGVNTGEAYGWLARSREADGVVLRSESVLTPDMLSDWTQIAALAVNDFEPVVAARFPPIATMLQSFHDLGWSPALLSGSGSTVFAILPGRPKKSRRGVDTSNVITTRTATRVEPVIPLD